MSDYGHDPTETAVPYTVFKNAGFSITFATEKGVPPKCDDKMLYGITQKLLVLPHPLYPHQLSPIGITALNIVQGATKDAVKQYETMIQDPVAQSPISWSDPDFSLDKYDLIFLPGGHEKSVRQLLDSPIISKHLASYFPSTQKPSKKAVGAICHGVQALAHSKLEDGKSVLHDGTTTALPGFMESFIFWATRLFLGDYYKTYGAGTDNVETIVRKSLDNPGKQWRGSLGSTPYVALLSQLTLIEKIGSWMGLIRTQIYRRR
jgi:putative intracellular protease/amidase